MDFKKLYGELNVITFWIVIAAFAVMFVVSILIILSNQFDLDILRSKMIPTSDASAIGFASAFSIIILGLKYKFDNK